MPPMTRAATLAALCLLSGAAQAQQYPETSSRGAQVRIQRDSAADRVVAKVYEGRYSFVRIESREPGADTNAQPLSLSPQALRALLGQVQIAGGKPEPLFSAEQLDELAAPLSQALARADAGQDVSIAAADRFGGLGPFAPLQATTARVFHRAGRLHLIVGLLRRDVDTPMRATGVLIAFEPGQRGRQQAAGLQLALAPGQGEVLRGDWVALATSPQAVAPVPAAPAAAAPATAAPATAAPAAAAPAAAAPAPTAGAAPAAAAAPSPSASDALYQRMAERLRTLERLHKDGLISDAEYREKRKDILGGL